MSEKTNKETTAAWISITFADDKWHVIKPEKNSVDGAESPVPGESYDDEQTAKIAGIILSKMLGTRFLDPGLESRATNNRFSI